MKAFGKMDKMTDETPETGAPRVRTKRWIKLVLGLSLALNLLIVGAVGGAIWRIGGHSDDRKGGPSARADAGGFALIRALPSDDRRALFREVRKAPRKSASEGRAQMQAMVTLLKTNPLDEAQLDALTEARLQDGETRQAQLSEAWKARVMAMTEAERATYAKRLEAVLAKGPRKNKDRD